MKRALIILSIMAIVCAHFMPYVNIKADTVDLSTLQDKIADVDTMVASDQQLFMQSLGLATALSMRQTGYSAPETSAIEDIGNWVWDRIHDIGDGTRDVAQWVVNRISNIIDGMKPDHSGGGHRFSYNPTDAPIYNALYTDDDWNSLVSNWASANTHNDNFISFDDVTDDVEGWGDRYWDNYIYTNYPNGVDGSGNTWSTEGMSVQLRNSMLTPKPSVIGIQYFASDSKRYITRLPNINNPVNTIQYIIFKPSSATSTTYQAYFYLSNNTYVTDVYGETDSGLNNLYRKIYSYQQTHPTTNTYVYEWVESTTQPGYLYSISNCNFTAPFTETKATNAMYSWYHASVNNSTYIYARYFNIACYWSSNYDGSDKQPFSVHPGTHTEWNAPIQTPIIINNTRAYISVTNNTSITDYTTVYNYVTNNNITNEQVVNNVFNQTVVNYILPNPTYIEQPEPTPEPIGPTPTPTGTPTGSPTGTPTGTPTGPIEITGIVEVTNFPTPPYDVVVVNNDPIRVEIIQPSITPDPSWGLDLPDVDYELPDITIPDVDDLTSAGNIQGTVLGKTLEYENENNPNITYTNVTGWLMSVIPSNQFAWMLVFGFICIVITFLARR